MSSHSGRRWHTAAEVAELLRISNYTVVALCRKGKLRASKVAETWRISDEAIEEYMRENENPRTASAGPRRRKRRAV